MDGYTKRKQELFKEVVGFWNDTIEPCLVRNNDKIPQYIRSKMRNSLENALNHIKEYFSLCEYRSEDEEEGVTRTLWLRDPNTYSKCSSVSIYTGKTEESYDKKLRVHRGLNNMAEMNHYSVMIVEKHINKEKYAIATFDGEDEDGDIEMVILKK